MTIVIEAERRREFDERGFTILDRVIDAETLEKLRAECAYFIDYMDRKLDERNTETMGITHKGKRYFVSGVYRKSAYMPQFLFGELMRDITATFLGDQSFLFVEQWVVKGPEQGMKFAWHQDAGYVYTIDPGNVPPPYITCWCALDDMSAENGTIYVIPHDRGGTRGRVLDHVREPGTNDLVGFDGDDPGELIECKAGSIAVFSSTSLHRSSANRTDAPRRAYLAQYSGEPVMHSNGDPWAFAVPFTRDGNVVYDAELDSR